MLSIIKKLLGESLTVLYSSFWSAVIIAVLLMVVYMYASKHGGLKATVTDWIQTFKKSGDFRRNFALCLTVSFILVTTLLNRTYWSNPLSNVIGPWSIYKEDGTFTVEPIKNTVLFIPYIMALFWSMKGKVLKNEKLGTVILAAVKYSFLFSALIETVQLLFSLGTFQLSDFFYNTLGGFICGLIYWICYRVKHRRKVCGEQLHEEDEHMDYDKIINDNAFFKWKDYDPLDIQYMRYAESNPSVIAAGHKIYDVYLGFCNARASLMFVDSENFGDIASDGSAINRLYAQCHFLQNALIEYAICLDLSWQVVWAYIQPSSLEYLMKQEYKDMEKECDRDNVLAQLKCAISQNGQGVAEAQAILDIVKNFDNDETTLKLRSIYNKIKHQGTIHFEGLGANFDHLSVSLNGKVPQMLHRDSFIVEEIKDLLYTYHVSFQKYMNDLIKIIMPEGYLDNEIDFVDAMSATVKMASVE